ncbi:MAG: cytosine deaminase, partial [Proteobacteria bacterium]|nr:cytosine deaminase [Pseudomonadota bacterium]
MSEVRLVRGRWIVTGGAAGDAVLDDAALALRGERIEALGAWQDLRRRYPQAEVIGSDRGAVPPGL